MNVAASVQTQTAKPQAASNSKHAGMVLQRKCACGSSTSSLTGSCPECQSKKMIQTKLAIGASNDPLEREADRVADQVVANNSPSSVSSLAFGRLQREEAPKEKTNEEKYKEGLEKLGEAFLKTPLGKELLEKIKQDTLVKGATELGKDFISTWPGKIVTGAAATGAVAALAATHNELPAQIPEIPLDVLTPGLSVQLTYKGPVDKPTEAMITFKFTEQAPKGRGDKKPLSATDKFRAETARLAAENAKFRAGMTYKPGSPEDLQQKAEQEAIRSAVLKYSGGSDIEATIKKYPWLATPQPKTGLQLTMPKPSFGIEAPALLGDEFKLKPPSEQKKKEDEPTLQKKLSIGASNDPLEDEADRIADMVLAAPAHPTASGAPVRIHRFTGRATEGTDTAPASVDRVLANSGRPMEPALQQDMEQRFGYDFSRVRVHSGGAAEQSARDVNANAYTVGHNVVFGAGRFEPRTHEGRRLIAHELTHVVQQLGGCENGLPAGLAQPSCVGTEVVQRDDSEEERKQKLKFEDFPLPPEVAESWGMPPVASPGANKRSNCHKPPPYYLRPKPQPSEEVIAATNCNPHHSKPGSKTPTPGDEEVMLMTGVERLLRAKDFAKEDGTLSTDVKAEIDALFTREAVVGMALFAAVYIAAQLTPAGWVADALALTVLTISAIFLGTVLFEIFKNLAVFASAVNARTNRQLRESGHALTKAIAKASVALVIALLTRTFKGAAKPYDGPTPPGLGDAVTPEGLVVRAPVEALPRPVEPPANLASRGGGAKGASGDAAPKGSTPSRSSKGASLRDKKASRTQQRGADIQEIFDEAQGKTPEQARATNDQGRSVIEKLGGTEPKQFQRGNFAHRFIEYILGKDRVPQPNEAEVVVELRDGTGDIIRADRLIRRPAESPTAEKGLLIEIKPKGRSADIGRAQLQGRVEALQREFPRKGGWEARVEEYDPSNVEAWLRSEGMSPANIAIIMELFGFPKSL